MSLNRLAAVATAALGAVLAFVAISILTSGDRGHLMIIGGISAVGAVLLPLRALGFQLQRSERRSRRR